MTATLALPMPPGDVVQASTDYYPGPPLRIAFSMVRVSRTDPAEAFLVRMLLQSESDLPTLDEPMAFPVYGRGRVLYALVGAGTNAVNIGGACAFLTGPCLCECKAPSIGAVRLMAADWIGGGPPGSRDRRRQVEGAPGDGMTLSAGCARAGPC